MINRLTLISLVIIFLAACTDTKSKILYEDLPLEGDVERGEVLFNQQNYRTAACNSCHLIGQLGGASPNLTGYGTLAGTRVAGQSAHEYTFYAITEPGQYLAENFGNVMPDKYDDKLKPQDIADLIAYLLTL